MFSVPPLFLALEQIEEKTSSAKRFAIYDVVSEGELFATVKIYVGPFKLGDAIQGKWWAWLCKRLTVSMQVLCN